MKSQKELSLNRALRKILSGNALKIAEILFRDNEVHYLQEYANIVSIKRLGFNDHGPVHMRKVVLNALKMAELLNSAGIKLTLEKDEVGSYEDSKIALILAGFLHDIGMSIGRENHQMTGAILAIPLIERILKEVFPEDIEKKIVIKSLVIECIIGHMATHMINSLEAGLILVADGCDMEKGRARIPMLLKTSSKVGDIHKYSAAAIEKVVIGKGKKRPIKIKIQMTASVGFFQVEEVLFNKINSSSVKSFIELYAGVVGRDMKCYL